MVSSASTEIDYQPPVVRQKKRPGAAFVDALPVIVLVRMIGQRPYRAAGGDEPPARAVQADIDIELAAEALHRGPLPIRWSVHGGQGEIGKPADDVENVAI